MAGKTVSEPAKAQNGALEPNDESRLIAAISYIFGVFVSVIIFLLKKEDRFVKFHAAQAIMVDLAVMGISIVAVVIGFGFIIAAGIATAGIGFFIGFWFVWLMIMIFGLLVFAMRLFLAFQAFSGKRFGLPLIGMQAEKIAAG